VKTADQKTLPKCPYCGGDPVVGQFPGSHNVWCSNQPVRCGNRSVFTVDEWSRRTGSAAPQLVGLISDDAYAMSFQSMGQYRSALIKAATSGESQ